MVLVWFYYVMMVTPSPPQAFLQQDKVPLHHLLCLLLSLSKISEDCQILFLLHIDVLVAPPMIALCLRKRIKWAAFQLDSSMAEHPSSPISSRSLSRMPLDFLCWLWKCQIHQTNTGVISRLLCSFTSKCSCFCTPMASNQPWFLNCITTW